MRRFLVVVVAACGGANAPAVNKAGDSHDEGAGELARASMRLTFGGPEQTQPTAARAHNRYGGDIYGGDPYGGDPYGGDPYGGASYAGWTVPQWNYTGISRVPPYQIGNALPGAIEGTVTWTGAAPAKLKTACGTIENPTLRVGSDKALRGALVYIEKVNVGRSPPYYGRPASVGGVVVKHGCALVPAAQIVSPLPASLAIHGDGVAGKVSVAGKAYDLQEGGVVAVVLDVGVTRVDGDGTTPAWAIAMSTPYYAITDDSGKFRIDELAVGTYDVTFWQPPVATAGANGAIGVGAPVVVHRTVRVDGAKPVRVDVALH